MAAWSSFRVINNLATKQSLFVSTFKRFMSGGHGNVMDIEVSRWQWNKFKDLLHYYFMVGLIPVGAIIFYSNVFIGPATLAPTPEGYTPKPWEYERHPLKRFAARYFQNSYQQEYEKYMAYLYQEDEKAKMRKISSMVKQKMKERHDYQAYYYRPISAKYFRQTKDVTERTKLVIGDND